MEQPSLGANSRSFGEDVSGISWNTKVLTVTTSPVLYPLLSQINPFHILIKFSEDFFSIIRPSVCKWTKWSPFLRYSN
jgi:hypothetical protein